MIYLVLVCDMASSSHRRHCGAVPDWGGAGDTFQETPGHGSGSLCPLLSVMGLGREGCLPFWLSQLPTPAGCFLLGFRAHPSGRFSPHSCKQLCYRVRLEGPSWAAPNTHSSTIKTFCIFGVWSSNEKLNSGHREQRIRTFKCHIHNNEPQNLVARSFQSGLKAQLFKSSKGLSAFFSVYPSGISPWVCPPSSMPNCFG